MCKEKEVVRRLISQLQSLNYDGLDTFDPEWVRSVLCGAGGHEGGARQALLLWVVRQLSPSTATDIHTAPQHTHSQKILQSLSCMGICQLGDTEVIEGTASATAQLRFWQTCLDSVENLRTLTSSRNNAQQTHPDLLMLHLTHSPYLQSTLQGGNKNFVPGDLVKKYRAWVKQGAHTPLPDSLMHTQEKLAAQQCKYDQVDEQWKVEISNEDSTEQQTSVCDALHNVSQQQSLLQGVYSSYIAPWTVSKEQLELSGVGPLVRDAREQLATVRKALEATEEAAQHCEELRDDDSTALHTTTLTPSLVTMLHTLANSHQA